MNTPSPSSTQPKLLEFYERRVLPTLFERLDRAFPEFQWTRVENGWTASRNPFLESRGPAVPRIFCRQPWGFVAEEGTAVSWLAYANGGRRPVDYEIVSAVRKLADLACVDDAAINRPFTAEEIREAHVSERRRELLEAFAAYCHVVLYSEQGQTCRTRLRRFHGLDWQHVTESSLGLYTTAADIHDYLAGVGFTAEEIHDSKVTRDIRLDGRLLVPWRDSCGRLQSIVAYSTERGRGRTARLYLNLRDGCLPDPFGLDVALRPDAGGRDHLILVESVLDVVFLQSVGLTNVASFGSSGRMPPIERWERLADLGVTKATLVFEDDREGHDRAVEAIREANRARRCPELFVLPPDAFASARGAATFTRLSGLGKLRNHIQQRIHAYHFVAEMFLRRHKPGTQWTDAALVEVLNEAVRFDAATYRPERALALERFFWPPILKATGAGWDVVHGLLQRSGKTAPVRPAELGTWDLLDFHRLLRELTDCYHANQSEEFKAIICAAADALQAKKPAERTEREAPIPCAVLMPRRRRRRPQPVPPTVEAPRIVPIQRPMAVRWPSPPDLPPRKPEVRPAVTLDVSQVAYEIWQQKGCPENADQECWYEAEQLVAKAQAEQARQKARQENSAGRRDWKAAA